MASPSIKSQAIRGSGWAIVGRIGRALIGIVTLAVISRHLTPGEFGLFALVTFIVGFSQIFADFGTRVALVQRPEITELEKNSVFWSNMASSLLLVAILYVTAPMLASLFGNEDMTGPLRAVLPVFLFVAVQGVSMTVLQRSFKFRAISIAELVGAACGAATAVALVLAGFNIAALVFQQLVGTLVVTVYYVIAARWRPRMQFSMAALQPLLSYGGYVTMANVIQYISNTAERPIIGGRLSAADLGFVAMGQQIVLSPLRMVVTMISKVMFPIMASIQNEDDRMRRGFITVQHGLTLIMAPICFGLWAVADPLVSILLGPGWEMVATLMGYTTLHALFIGFNTYNSSVFSAKGQAKFQFHWSIFAATATIITLMASVPWGIVGMVAARLGLTMLVLTPINASFALRLIGLRWGEVLSALVRPLLAGALMAAVVRLVDMELVALGAGNILRLAIDLPVGAVAYAAFILLIDRKRALSIVGEIARRGKPKS